MTRKKGPAFLGTYVTLAVLAGLGAYVYFVESKRPGGEEGPPKEKAFAFERAKAKEITLAPAGQPEVHLVKGTQGWSIAAPQPAPADAGEVDSLLGALEGLEVSDVVTEQPARLAEYGLEPPRAAVIVAVDGQPEPVALHLGDKTPDGASLYAKLPGRPRVFTVASYLEGSLVKTAFDLRDRDLLHLERAQVRGLEVAGPEGGFTLARTGEEWAFTAPLRTRAGRWSVDGLVGALESLRMEAVIADDAKDLAPFGLATPARTVAVVMADGQRKALEIGAKTPDGRHHARVAGSAQVVAIAPALPDDLAKGMAEYRAKRLLDVATHEVEAVEVESVGTKQAYARTTRKDDTGGETHAWKRTAPDAKDVQSAAMQDALFEIGGVEVSAFVDAPGPPGGYGLDAPVLKVTLRFTGDRAPEWFELGQAGGAWHARRAGDESVLSLDAAKAAALVDRFKKL